MFKKFSRLTIRVKRNGDFVIKVTQSLPLSPVVIGPSCTCGHNHNSSCDTSTGCFQEADPRVSYLSCENLLHVIELNKYV